MTVPDSANAFGFSALPGGRINNYKYSDQIFIYAESDGFWWSATEIDSNSIWVRTMGCYEERVIRGEDDKEQLFSVRCVQD